MPSAFCFFFLPREFTTRHYIKNQYRVIIVETQKNFSSSPSKSVNVKHHQHKKLLKIVENNLSPETLPRTINIVNKGNMTKKNNRTTAAAENKKPFWLAQNFKAFEFRIHCACVKGIWAFALLHFVNLKIHFSFFSNPLTTTLSKAIFKAASIKTVVKKYRVIEGTTNAGKAQLSCS